MPKNTHESAERAWSVQELAVLESCCEVTIRRAIRSGKLAAHRLPGGRYRVTESALAAWRKRLAVGVPA